FTRALTWLALVVALSSFGSRASAAGFERNELKLESGADYSNPQQEATLSAVFTSPKGQASKAYGFWDGGKTWRIRFRPTEAGRWTYATTCSDAKDKGLHGQTGEFTAKAAGGKD